MVRAGMVCLVHTPAGQRIDHDQTTVTAVCMRDILVGEYADNHAVWLFEAGPGVLSTGV